ncbi:MAG: outer membrane lipoprotein-sorting protein [Candidatus Mcinerneyibacterium aminivorans]|uniref:Outer membrane lipoprotein-sorting protein n=1 Tax=Candidatus Mcinerneyibacterium aminivorans TaxID=2703815 RepID=A0A5D0MEI0_9BACT|nr:MAG: outer membrane lipoprotein-sorting protein [Candidatus Mcinerneyibacterium aminivorans]
MKRIILIFILILTISFTVYSLTGKEVMERVDNRETGSSRHALMGMDLVDSEGNVRARTLEVWSIKYNKGEDLDKIVMEFQKPDSIENTRFLQVENKRRDDDKWIYLPALGRVRRIASNQGDQSFVGSDFTYDDMDSRDVEEDEHKLLKDDKYNGYECWVVESIPKKIQNSQYSKRISWITKKHLVPVKVEMYDKKKNELLKVLKVKKEIKKIDGIWTPVYTVMENVQSNHSTRLYVKGNEKRLFLEYNKKISPKRFTQRFLKTGR